MSGFSFVFLVGFRDVATPATRLSLSVRCGCPRWSDLRFDLNAPLVVAERVRSSRIVLGVPAEGSLLGRGPEAHTSDSE